MEMTAVISAFVTMFVVIDPIGLAPVFIALTHDMTPGQRLRTGWTAVAIAASLLTLFGLAGEAILAGIGISLPAFRIAGGVLLFLTALDMLFERRTQRREGKATDEDPGHDPSVFPLATPLLAGPGALASMILLVNEDGSLLHTLMIHGVMLTVLAIAALLFAMAGGIAQMLGRTGTMVLTRLFGMLLAALSIQFIIDGLKGSGLF